MAAIFAKLIIICKDFATPSFTNFITGKNAIQICIKCYWSVNMVACTKNCVKNTKKLQIRYLPVVNATFIDMRGTTFTV